MTTDARDITSAEPSMADRAYEILRDRLVLLDIAPGQPINEAQFAAELSFGRTPIREALKRLEIDHLVVSYPRRGTFATAVEMTDLASISEIRLLLEPKAALAAANNPNQAMKRQLMSALDSLENMDPDLDKRQLLKQDLTIHRLISKASESKHLEEILVRLDNLATRIWCLVIDRLPELRSHITEHKELLEAIIDGDGKTAAHLAEKHVIHFEQSVRDTL